MPRARPSATRPARASTSCATRTGTSPRTCARLRRRDRHPAGQRRHHGVAAQDPRRPTSMINGDSSPPPPVLAQVITKQKDQLQLVPNGGGRWISLNTTIKPFDNENVRKAIVAGFDRDAMRHHPRRLDRRRRPDALHPAGPAGLRRGRRHQGPGRSTSCRTRRVTCSSRPSTYKAKAEGVPVTNGKYAGGRRVPDGRRLRGCRRRHRRGRQGELREAGLQGEAPPRDPRLDVHQVLQRRRRRRSRSARTWAG